MNGVKKYWLILVLLMLQSIYGQWSDDPTKNTKVSYYDLSRSISDSNSGIIIASSLFHFVTDVDIYIQKVNRYGYPQWISTPDSLMPMVVTKASNAQELNGMFSDNEGGAVLSWIDYRRSTMYPIFLDSIDIYVRRVSTDGKFPWGEEGINLRYRPSTKTNLTFIGDNCTVSDGFGGLIVRWYEEFLNDSIPYIVDSANVYLQKISKAGEFLWTEGGISWDSSVIITMCADLQGGLIIAAVDYVGLEQHHFLCKLGYAGESLWRVDHPEGYLVKLLPDGEGGAYYIYETDTGNDKWQYKCNRIGRDGTIFWSESANIGPVFGGSNDIEIYIYPYKVDDGLIITWEQGTLFESETYDIYATKIDQNGNILWGDSLGLAVCDTINYQVLSDYSVYPDHDGGIFVAWIDWRHKNEGFSAIYIQHIFRDGKKAWANQGVLVSYKSIDSHSYISTIADTNNCSIVCWDEFNYGGERGVFAQQVNADGKLGVVPSSLMEPDGEKLMTFQLSNAYPNPFNSSTTIVYHLPEGMFDIDLSIYNIRGQKVTTLVKAEHLAGRYLTCWYGLDYRRKPVSSGVYYCKLTASNSQGRIFTDTKRVVFLK